MLANRTPCAAQGYAAAYLGALTRKPDGPLIVRPGCTVERFESLAAFARRVQELRGTMGLERRRRVFTLQGYGTLTGRDMFAVDRDTGGQIWLGTSWVDEAIDDRGFDALVKAERPAKLARAAA